jgi:NDP-sugar pyrophosphorylase family protein
MKPTLLILAAGMGSRYGGLKQIEGIGPAGEILLEYSIYDAIRAGFGKVVFVIREELEEAFKEKVGNKLVGKIAMEFVYQAVDTPIEGMDQFSDREKPWGTGHAILVAQHAIKEPFAVINADDYYGISGFESMAQFLQKDCTPAHYAMIGYSLGNTLSENGSVSRGVCRVDEQHRLLTVNERTNIRRHEDGIFYEENSERYSLTEETYVSMNFWGLHQNVFEHLRREFIAFVAANHTNPKSEFYIPTAINTMMNQDGVQVTLLPSADLWYGVTYREDKPTVEQAFQGLIAEERYPNPLWGSIE